MIGIIAGSGKLPGIIIKYLESLNIGHGICFIKEEADQSILHNAPSVARKVWLQGAQSF